MNDEEPLYIKLEDVDRHENGDVTYKFDMDEQAAKCAAQEGMKLFLYCGVSEVDLQDVYDWILSKEKMVNDDLTRRHTHALHKIDVLEDQIEEMMRALEIADKWMTDLDMYADPDYHLAPSLQHVRDTYKKFKVSK